MGCFCSKTGPSPSITRTAGWLPRGLEDLTRSEVAFCQLQQRLSTSSGVERITQNSTCIIVWSRVPRDASRKLGICRSPRVSIRRMPLIPSVEAASFCGSIITSAMLSGRQLSCENLEAAAKLFGCLSLMPILKQPRGRRYSRSRNIHTGNGCRARLEKQASSYWAGSAQ